MKIGHASGNEATKGAKTEMDKALSKGDEPIYVMRHGKTALDAMKRSDGWLDFPLTDEGRRGIIPAQQYLKDLSPLVCIYAPPMKRNVETAEIIQSGMGIDEPDIVICEEAKTWNLGKQLIGSQKYPARPIVKYFMDHPDETPEGGESMNAFHKRFLTWIKGIMGEKRGGAVLIVLSGSSIRALSEHLTGDRESLELDEGGLMKMTPTGKMWNSNIIFGGKEQSEDDPTRYGS